MSLYDAVHGAFHDPTTPRWRALHGAVWVLIVVSIALVALDVFFRWHPPAVDVVNHVIVGLFATELLLRVLSFRPQEVAFYRLAPRERARAEFTGRLRFLFTPLNLVDLICVLEVLHPSFRALRAFRALRLLRDTGWFRYTSPFKGIELAFVDNKLLWWFGFTVLGSAIGIGGVSFWMVDRGRNPQVETLGDALWWAIVTITTVGYGDITPSRDDPMGRLIASALMISGLFTMALFAGIVSNTLLNSVMSLRVEQFRMSNTIGHIVICGYNEGSRLLLDTLERELSLDHIDLLIFAPTERSPEVPPEVRWIQGDPTKESELEKARIAHARAVVLVGARGQLPQQADAFTILTAFTVRRYLKNHPETRRRVRPVYVVGEILDHENVEHAYAAGCDEVIETTRLGFSLLSHAVEHHGTAALLSILASADGQNLYVGKVPADLPRPLTFGELGARLSERGVIALGLREFGQDRLNPPVATQIGMDAKVIYIASSPVLS